MKKSVMLVLLVMFVCAGSVYANPVTDVIGGAAKSTVEIVQGAAQTTLDILNGATKTTLNTAGGAIAGPLEVIRRVTNYLLEGMSGDPELFT